MKKLTTEQVNEIQRIVEVSIDEMFYNVLQSVDAKSGNECWDELDAITKVTDRLIELAILHASNNIDLND